MRQQLAAELHDLLDTGLAANVQTWARVGVKSNVALCKAKRAECRRLLRKLIRVVEEEPD